MKTSVVFDCMVFLQAVARPQSPAFKCFELLDTHRITLYLSPAVLLEIGEVLSRSYLQQKFPLLTAERVSVFLGQAQAKAIMLTHVPRSFVFERDPKDESYINLAIAASASFLVSCDNDLLDLMTEQKVDGQGFRQRFPTLAIVTPMAFIQEITRRAKTRAE